MKKLMLLLLLATVGLSLSAQKTHRVMGWKITKDIPKNELKVNLPMTIFLSSPEISYEQILDTDMSVGAALSASLDTERNPYQFAFTPYFRWFFGGNSQSLKRYGAGFFIETNGFLSSNDTADFGGGLGLALGWKYLSKNNWVGEFYFGGGRDFANDGAYPRMGISIGKRF